MRTSSIRFTGMASGMDTDSIVKDMLRPQQYKIDNQKKAQALLKLKQDAWKDMNKKLFDFHRNFTQKLGQNATYNKTIATSSNESVLDIIQGADTPAGTHKFDVTELAEAVGIVGRGADGKGLKAGTKISELMEVGESELPEEIKMMVNGKEITIDLRQKDKDGNVVIDDDGNVVMKDFTLAELAVQMNGQLKGTGFTAKFDEQNGSFFISSTATGEDQKIIFNHDSDGKVEKLFENLGIKSGVDNHGKAHYQGKDAIYTYNGVEGFNSSSNQIEINGVKAILKSEGKATINSSKDPDEVYGFIKEFITEYNNLIDEIHLKIGTKPGKDIKPLTAEERKGMSDTEIKLWEENINNSLFYKDPHLTNFVDTARKVLGQALTGGEFGEGTSLASFGITTGTWREQGKLFIEGDEDLAPPGGSQTNKLKEAIGKDPDKVASFFETIGKELYDVFNKDLIKTSELKSAMNFYNDKVMTKEMETFDKEIDTLQERLYKLEQMHYAKFAAMEKMLNSLNSQSSWLSQQFGGN